MTSYLQQRQEELEVRLLEFELVKRWVLLGLTVLLCLSAVASTVVCALHGWSWPAAGSGLSVAVLGGLTVRGVSPPVSEPPNPSLKALTTLLNSTTRDPEQDPAAGEWIKDASRTA
jgi:hypothetical protein